MSDGLYLTRRQLIRMTNALPASAWEMTLRLQGGGRRDVIPVTYDKFTLLSDSTIRFLRAKNFEGYHICGRPLTTRCIMIDDVGPDEFVAMMMSDIMPALVVETSPYNFQVWFSLSNNEIDEDLAVEAARIMTHRYDGDSCSVKRSQPARIPGFTNRKPMYACEVNGKEIYPFAKILSCRGHSVERGIKALLAEAQAALDARCTSRLSSLSIFRGCGHLDIDAWHSDMTPEEANGIYSSVVEELKKRFGWNQSQLEDRSAVDDAVAKFLLRRRYHSHDVMAVILCGAGKGRERGWNYASQTVQKNLN